MARGRNARAAVVGCQNYLDVLDRDYLRSYLNDGGATVKFVAVDNPETATYFHSELFDRSRRGHFITCSVAAADVRLHLSEELFFAVVKQIDWMSLAVGYLRGVYEQSGIPIRSNFGGPPSVDLRRVAAINGLDPGELYRTVRRMLEKEILGDDQLLHQFRIAILRICQTLLNWSEVDQAGSEITVRWLHGHSVPLAQLRSVGLYGRVNRNNARFLLVSLTRWLHCAGAAGLVLHLDLSRLTVARRPPVHERRGFYYTKSAVLDTFEMLRQLVDSIDELRSTLIAVVLPRQMLNDSQRGLPAYHALYLRVASEIKDQYRANPLAPSVRVVRDC